MITRRGLLAGSAGVPLGVGVGSVSGAGATPEPGSAGEGGVAEDELARERERMVAEVERDLRETAVPTGRPGLSPRVQRALRKVPRHRFVPLALAHRAYENRALPIGEEQTVSQPTVVALMTDVLELQPTDRVLEIGTGSGYQAAVLAEVAARVYTIEIVRPLGARAAALLAELGYGNVETRIGDGWRGWPEAAPFDAIVVTAAPEELPPPLVDQLRPGGRLAAPVGTQHGVQELLLLRKGEDGSTATRTLLPVRFVPLTRER